MELGRKRMAVKGKQELSGMIMVYRHTKTNRSNTTSAGARQVLTERQAQCHHVQTTKTVGIDDGGTGHDRREGEEHRR